MIIENLKLLRMTWRELWFPTWTNADSPTVGHNHLIVDSDGSVDYGATVTGRPMPDDEDEDSIDAGLDGGITIVPSGDPVKRGRGRRPVI